VPRLFDFSISKPVDNDTGKGWINPQNGQVYIRLGDNWIPFAGGDPATFKKITIFIKGIDKTAIVRAKSLSITDAITSQVDTCSFILDDLDGTNRPHEGDEVIIYYGDPPVKIFAGEIQSAPQSQICPGTYKYSVSCADYSRMLDKKRVVETYSDKSCKYIIEDIIASYAPEFTTFNVQDGPTIYYIAFNYKTPMDCLRELARLSGFDWYVDYDMDIHFFASETNSAPYELNETASSGRFKNLQIRIDKSQLRNRIYVRGGYYLSSLFEQEIVADGEQLEFPLAYEPHAPLSVYVDTVEKSLGIDNIDTAGKDFVYNATEKTIKNLDLAGLTDGQVLKVKYRYKIPIIVIEDDEDSQAALKAMEGGDGIYEYLIVDESLGTLEAARDRVQAELRQYANALIEGSFITDQDGYRSGQLLPVNIPTRGIESQYLIQTVTKKSIGGGYLEYSVKFATLLTGLTDFLISLWQASQKIYSRDDEVQDTTLDEILQKTDALALTHAVPAFAEFTPPFQYGPGGSPQGIWNESQWG